VRRQSYADPGRVLDALRVLRAALDGGNYCLEETSCTIIHTLRGSNRRQYIYAIDRGLHELLAVQ
jgi:hypothetical protein